MFHYLYDETQYLTYIFHIDECGVFVSNCISLTNDNYIILESALSHSHELAFTKTQVRFNRKKHNINNWMNGHILSLINNKKKMSKDLIKNKNNPHFSNFKTKFTTYQKILKRAIRDRKREFNFNLFSRN